MFRVTTVLRVLHIYYYTAATTSSITATCAATTTILLVRLLLLFTIANHAQKTCAIPLLLVFSMTISITFTMCN